MADLQCRVTELIRGKRTKRAILAALKAAGIRAEDASKESGYMNIRIPIGREYIRIYRSYMGVILVQRFKMKEMRYSGITVFEPSGRRSL